MEVEIKSDLPPKTKRQRKHVVASESREPGLSPNGAALEPVKAQKEEKISASANAPLVEVEVLRIRRIHD
jgi:hypothetical protein